MFRSTSWALGGEWYLQNPENLGTRKLFIRSRQPLRRVSKSRLYCVYFGVKSCMFWSQSRIRQQGSPRGLDFTIRDLWMFWNYVILEPMICSNCEKTTQKPSNPSRLYHQLLTLKRNIHLPLGRIF